MNQAESEGTNIVDVDGSYLYRKYRSIVEAGETTVAQLEPSPPPLTGWKAVTSVTCEEIAPSIPVVTSGTLLMCSTMLLIMFCYFAYRSVILVFSWTRRA